MSFMSTETAIFFLVPTGALAKQNLREREREKDKDKMNINLSCTFYSGKRELTF